MPHLPYSIELHDSRFASIRSGASAVTIALSPAYLHKDGKGWRQEAELIIAGAVVGSHHDELPTRIADGTLKTPGGPYHNLLMLPLRESGLVKLEIELESGTVIRLEGESVEVRLLGEPKFVEDVA